MCPANILAYILFLKLYLYRILIGGLDGGGVPNSVFNKISSCLFAIQ